MNLILVDDEESSLHISGEEIRKADPFGTLHCFLTAEGAVTHVMKNRVDAAFLDVEMPEMNGLELAQRLKMEQPDINIIFLTGYSQYAAQAFALHASGYLQKPVRKEEVERELKDLRYPAFF